MPCALENGRSDNTVLTVLAIPHKYLLLDGEWLVRAKEPILLLIHKVVLLRHRLLTGLAIIGLLVLRSANIDVLIVVGHVGAFNDGGAPDPIIVHLFLDHRLDDEVNQIIDNLLTHCRFQRLDLAACQPRYRLVIRHL